LPVSDVDCRSALWGSDHATRDGDCHIHHRAPGGPAALLGAACGKLRYRDCSLAAPRISTLVQRYCVDRASLGLKKAIAERKRKAAQAKAPFGSYCWFKEVEEEEEAMDKSLLERAKGARAAKKAK
jgi:hypothetical protein